MRRILVGVVAIGALLWGGPAEGASMLDRAVHDYTTPHTVARFLHAEFHFERDETAFGVADWWQSPDEFLARRRGDCEDYALLARELLARNGITAFIFSLTGADGYAHTVCVFLDEQGRYNMMNQDKVRYYRAKTLEALASMLYQAWTHGGITEQMGTRGHLVRGITNSHPISMLASMNAFALQ